jgi:lipopolysaccharide assembly protein A
MRFLKTLFYVLVIVAITIFSVQNWTPITVNLWGGLVMDTVLPVVIISAFLLGLLPTLLLHQATRWNLNRKLDNVQRSLNQMTTPPAVAVTPSASEGALPPVATPIAVPPGVL